MLDIILRAADEVVRLGGLVNSVLAVATYSPIFAAAMLSVRRHIRDSHAALDARVNDDHRELERLANQSRRLFAFLVVLAAATYIVAAFHCFAVTRAWWLGGQHGWPRDALIHVTMFCAIGGGVPLFWPSFRFQRRSTATIGFATDTPLSLPHATEDQRIRRRE